MASKVYLVSLVASAALRFKRLFHARIKRCMCVCVEGGMGSGTPPLKNP